jgi:hypothetical protein
MVPGWLATCVTDIRRSAINLQSGIAFVRNFTNSAERPLGEHAVFHTHNDYAKLQVQHFGLRARVTD